MTRPDDDFQKALAAWLCGCAETHEQQLLEQRLREDPAARQCFARHCVAEMALREGLAQQAKATPAPSRQRRRTTTRHRRRQAHRPFPPLLWACAVAAALVLALVVARTTSPPDGPDSPADTDRAIPSPATATATVVSGAIHQGGRELGPGDQLAIGLPLATSDQSARFDWSQGQAEATMGPDSRLTLSASGRMLLEGGRIELAVTPIRNGPGPQVETAELRLSVIGTRFLVSRSQGRSRVEVFSGRVRVHEPTGERILGPGDTLDREGSLSVPPGTDPRSALILVVEDDSGTILGRYRGDQPIPIPRDQPVAIAVHGPAFLDGLRAWIDDQLVSKGRPGLMIEEQPPYYLWGDRDGDPYWERFPNPGRRQLRLQLFDDVDRNSVIHDDLKIDLLIE